MSTVEVKAIVHLPTRKLIIYADIAFDSVKGPYVELYEIFNYEPGVDRNGLKTQELSKLNYSEFEVTAQALTELCDNAIINETIYNDLEGMYIDRYLNRVNRENA